MQIQCPGCGIELELPPEAVGRHLLCDACNTKFEVELSAARVVQQPKIISKEAKRTYDKKQLDDLAQSKGLKKFYRLFVLAPASIKFIAIYTICLVVLDLVACATFGDKPSSIGIILLISLFPLLKRKEKAWRWLAVLCYLSFAASAVMLVIAFTLDNIDGILPGISSKVEFIVTGILSALVNLPIFIALRRSTARQWACK